MQSIEVEDFPAFIALLSDHGVNPELTGVGQRSLTFIGPSADAYLEIGKLLDDIKAYIEAREYFRGQSEEWEHRYRALAEEHQAMAHSLAEERQALAHSLALLRDRSLRSIPRRAWSRLIRAVKK